MERKDQEILVQTEYDRIFNLWYNNQEVQRSRLVIQWGNEPSRYIHARNEMVIVLDETLDNEQAPLRDVEVRSPKIWPTWKRELYHEMLHEYQFKIIQNQNELAIQLHAQLQNRQGFCGDGHNVDFYKAIVAKARFFETTPEDLAGSL